VRDLVADLVRTYGVNQESIRLQTIVNDVNLEVDTAIPCGLIINELVSNALKYAFPPGQSGEISVELSRIAENEFLLIVRDDGIGLPKDFDWRTSNSLGLKLVTDLTMQLDGKMQVETTHGTTFRISFRELHYKDRS
jgi:two-component sensor histidine kinase